MSRRRSKRARSARTPRRHAPAAEAPSAEAPARLRATEAPPSEAAPVRDLFPTLRQPAVVDSRATRVEQGERIRQARRTAGLKQAALARLIGVPLGVLERLEDGTADPAGYIDAIAEATHESPQWLRVGPGNQTIADVMQRVVELQQRTEDLNGRVAQLEQQLPSQARPKPQGPTK